jgi:hypothetical protein
MGVHADTFPIANLSSAVNISRTEKIFAMPDRDFFNFNQTFRSAKTYV